MGTVVLLRHGQSVWNAENLFTGWYDSPLSDIGRAEAEAGGRLLREEGLLPDVVHTSLLTRAIATAEVTLQVAGRRGLGDMGSGVVTLGDSGAHDQGGEHDPGDGGQHGQVGPAPAQGGHSRPEAAQRGVELPEQVEDRPALRLRPGPGRAVKAGHRAGDLAHSLLRPAADAQRKGQPQPRLGGLLGGAGPVGQVDGRPQVTHRAVDVLQMRGGDPEGALGVGLGGEIALGVRLPHDRGGESDRASRVGLRDPSARRLRPPSSNCASSPPQWQRPPPAWRSAGRTARSHVDP